MAKLEDFGDAREIAACVHCGGSTETRDHVPSKVFLDEPYPLDLPTVCACEECNREFSLDEEYLACLIECVVAGSVSPDALGRTKIKKILKAKPALMERLRAARREAGGATLFGVETERVAKVVLKLVRCHAVYDLHDPTYFKSPDTLHFTPLSSLSDHDRASFETPPRMSLWPAIGSRALQRAAISFPENATWITVQPARYRYLTAGGEAAVVLFVIREYLACEALWKS